MFKTTKSQCLKRDWLLKDQKKETEREKDVDLNRESGRWYLNRKKERKIQEREKKDRKRRTVRAKTQEYLFTIQILQEDSKKKKKEPFFPPRHKFFIVCRGSGVFQ